MAGLFVTATEWKSDSLTKWINSISVNSPMLYNIETKKMIGTLLQHR